MENRILYLYHHMGMGDIITCSGIVRHYLEKYQLVYLFVKPQYLENAKFLYSDVTNIKYMVMDDWETRRFIKKNLQNKYKIVGITPEWFTKLDSGIYETLDLGFYEDAGVPLQDKWDKFVLNRDMEREKDAFYNKMKLKDGEEFLFVHDRGEDFKPEYIPQGIRIVKPSDHLDVNFFDFIYTMEKAKEVHLHNSSFFCLADIIKLKNDKLFLHEYARTDMGERPYPKLVLDWKFLP